LPGGWHVDGEPLRFFHFSGVPKDDVSKIARHQDRLDGDTIGPFITEFHTYLARMASNGLKPSQEAHYSYSLQWHSKPIESQALRAALRRTNSFKAESLADFANEKPIAELLRPTPELPVDEMFPISRLLYDAWLEAPVLARQYPLFTAEHRARFLYWVLTEGYAPLQIDKSLLPWRELMMAVPGALGGRLAVPPIIWLVWLSDKKLRRESHFKDEASYASLVIELQKQVSNGKRPPWVLPSEYALAPVVGEGDDAVNVAQYAMWSQRKDLQAAFDLDSPEGRLNFLGWCDGPSPKEEYPWMVPLVSRRTLQSNAA
jgi:hypothetical protein